MNKEEWLDDSIKRNKEKADKGSIANQGVLGYLYFEKGDYKESFKYLNLAVKKRASRPMYYLAKIYENGFGVVDKNLEKAKELYKNSLPNEWMANFNLANIYKKENNQEKATKYYKKFLEVCPNYKETREAEDYLNKKIINL